MGVEVTRRQGGGVVLFYRRSFQREGDFRAFSWGTRNVERAAVPPE